jgi:hypothetical protein
MANNLDFRDRDRAKKKIAFCLSTAKNPDTFQNSGVLIVANSRNEFRKTAKLRRHVNSVQAEKTAKETTKLTHLTN